MCGIVSAGGHTSGLVVVTGEGIHAEVVRDAELQLLVVGQHGRTPSGRLDVRWSGQSTHDRTGKRVPGKTGHSIQQLTTIHHVLHYEPLVFTPQWPVCEYEGCSLRAWQYALAEARRYSAKTMRGLARR